MEHEIKLYFIMLIVILVLSAIWLVHSLIVLAKLKIQESKMNQMYKQLQSENTKEATNYSEKVLEYTKMFIGQITVLKFKAYVDNHEIDKVTKANIQNLASDVATTVHKSINLDNIQFDDTLFTKEFYEQYIIDSSLMHVKRLLEKTINANE